MRNRKKRIFSISTINQREKKNDSSNESTRSNFNKQSVGHRARNPIVMILVTILILTALQQTQFNSYVEAGLIHIYHKYRPKTDSSLQDVSGSNIAPTALGLEGFGTSQLNDSRSLLSAASSEDITDDPDESVGLGSTNHHDIEHSTAVEFTSPMKRIMELIGGHPPVIVLSDNSIDTSSNNEQQQNSIPTLTSSSTSQGGSSNQQHWTILDPNGHMVATTTTTTTTNNGHNQPSLLAAQQQLYHTSVPFEQQQQYFLATPATGNGNNQHFTVVPTASLTPAFTYQLPFQLSPSAGMVQDPSHQTLQLSQQQQQGSAQFVEASEKAQPIFLSSYVPEMPGTVKQLTDDQPRPNSIQQVQYSQVDRGVEKASTQKKTSSPKANDPGESSDDSSSDSGNDSSEPPDTDDDKSKGESDEPGSGSISYENKYDSDKDEQPRESVVRKGSKSAESRQQPLQNALASTGLDDTCLQCICRASSGCDSSLRCITRGADEKYCGPFQLTEEYWNMAGSPQDDANSFISFEDCSNNEDCATETVVNYMKKYLKDCDDDGQITCMDYARLHRLKSNECDNNDELKEKHEDYWTKFQHCAENHNRTRDGDDEHI